LATSFTSRFIFGTKDVASAGTAVQVDGTGHRIKSILLIAHSDNVGRIFYGGADVSSSTQKGLAATESITVDAGDRDSSFKITEIFIDAATDNDGVDFIAVRA